MTVAEKKIDYGLIPVIDVAREVLGQESRERSTASERHFSDHGGLFVNIKKNRWYSHGNATGGDAIDLVRFANDCDYKAAFGWLRSHGFESYLGEPPAPKKVLKEYDYTDENGARLYQTVRFEPKDFRQRRSDGNGGWTWKGPERPVPYKLPEMIKSGDAPVLIAGGEKDVDNLRSLGFTATCNHGGEGKWWPELTPYFKDRRVFLLCDNDEQGEKHQQVVGAALNGVAREIRVVRFPELPAKGDVSDFIELGFRDGQDGAAIKKVLAERFRAALPWAPTSSPNVIVTGDDWPEPLSLPEGLSPVASLDMALLPAKIAPWVCDISERMQCPPDYVGSTALTALGSVLGRRIGIAPDRQTDWFEVPNLWQCAVGRPGAMKTPAIGEALKPLHRLEVKAREKYDAEAADYGKALSEWKLRMDAAEAKARADLKKNPEAKVSFDIAEPPAPIERRFITNDTTYEKLGEILAQNPNGVLAHRDELVSLLRTLDREEYAAARGFFLTAWGGKERYTFDRIGRGRVHIEGACLSIIGSTQPGRLAEYIRRAVTGTSGDDGMIQRFGLLVWPDQSPAWEHVDRYPLSEAREQAWKIFETFDGLIPGAVGAHPISEYGGIPVLRLDAEAQDLFLEWRKAHERQLWSPDSEMTPALESHFAKYRKLVPSLALINHLADVGHGAVGGEAMARALGLATYLETHARRAYGAGPEAETAAAKAILSHIRKGDLTDGFTAREIHQHKWSNLSDRGQVQAGLDLLCDLDWLRAVDKKHIGAGRPTAHYRVNPRALR
jgi:Protein of unknown function (DUF3987)